MATKHFVNLTNGIEALPLLDDYAFIRIQSTACEQKRWDALIQDLDYNFLMSLALGHTCVVYDFGARKNVPRAVYQGLEFVRYVLTRRWFGKHTSPFVKGHNCGSYFSEVYERLDDATFKKIDYFRKFLMTDEIRLTAETSATEHDGDHEFYRMMLGVYAEVSA